MTDARPAGCLPDDPDDCVGDAVASQILSRAGVAWRPPQFDWKHLVKRIYDQKRNSCTGHATAAAAGLRARIMGSDVDDGSTYGVYALGRMKTAGFGPLRDTGARPRDIFTAASTIGVPPRGSWPPPGCDDSNIDAWINRRLDDDWSAVSDAFQYRISEFAWVEDAYDQRADVICDLLYLGFPVTLALRDDPTFRACKDLTPIPAPSPDDTTTTSHYVYVVGYQNGCPMIANSWSESFGQGGYAFLSPERVAHPSTQSIAAIGVTVY